MSKNKTFSIALIGKFGEVQQYGPPISIYYYYYYIIINIYFKGRHFKAGREWMYSISPKTPTPQSQRIDEKEEKDKALEDKKGNSNTGHQGSIDPALKTCQFYIIKHDVNKIVP